MDNKIVTVVYNDQNREDGKMLTNTHIPLK